MRMIVPIARISPIQAFFRATFFATIVLLTISHLRRVFSAIRGNSKPADGEDLKGYESNEEYFN